MPTTSRPITRADVRNATIAAFRAVRSEPWCIRLTPGQHAHIVAGIKGGKA